MNKYNKIARKIKFTLIILILLAIMYPVTIIVFNIFNYVELTNYLLSISSYLGAIVGSIIVIIGAVYVIFVILAFEEKNKYKKIARKIKFTLIILILLAIMYPVTIIVFNIFNYVELTNYLLSISSYLGAIVGSIIGIIGAVYVIFVSLAFEEKNKYKNKLPKKLRTLDRIKELENEMILFSYNEGIDLKNSGINKATYTYVKRFKEFYE